MPSRSVAAPRRRRRLFKALAMMLALFAGLMLAEGLLRLFPSLLSQEFRQAIEANPKNYGVAHPYVGHLHKPNATIPISSRDFTAYHHTDALGFRNTWPWPEKADVVLVGDSVTFGYGVADGESWPALLSKQRPHEAMINLGLIGAGPQQYLRLYETFGAKLRPKVLVVGFLASNDFWDADAFDHWLKSGGEGNYMVWRDFGRPQHAKFDWRDPLGTLRSFSSSWVEPVLVQSYLLQFLAATAHQFSANGWKPGVAYKFPDGSQVMLHPGGLEARTRQAQPDRPEFRLAVDAIDQLRTTAAEQGTHVLVVLQPGKEEVYLPMMAQVPDSEKSLRDELTRLGIEYLDLGPAFRQRAARERLFYEVDGHPNAAGYALIAELVGAHLRQHAKRYGLSE